MALLVVGSIAFDSIRTPDGAVDDALGGSASFFAYVASFFTPPRLVGVVVDGPQRACGAGAGVPPGSQQSPGAPQRHLRYPSAV